MSTTFPPILYLSVVPIIFHLQAVGFHTPGSLRICTTPDRMDEARYQMARQGWHKAPQWLVTPEEIEKMVPIMNMDSILGGLFNPGRSRNCEC